jgi:hypothetical protein
MIRQFEERRKGCCKRIEAAIRRTSLSAYSIFGSRSMRLDLLGAPTDENDLSYESENFDSLLLS